ncbi:glycosyltransferase family 4 protein [Silvibacterium sp.]|uniref:glycosyltransferase family 4 protein n=1 Tax=Silvibacterium sp. TaxID=1964179 RepID=UPI0039E45A5D
MHILLCSNWFSPSFGGVETVSKVLAEEFTHAGHRVTVVTSSKGPSAKESGVPYEIVRNPSQAAVFGLARSADVLMQNLISLRTIGPLIASRKPLVVTHQSWMRRHSGRLGPENRLKRLATHFCYNVSISRAIADSLPVKSEVIGNPFEASEFDHLREISKDRDIVFLGRLVSDKGCDLLLHALSRLKTRELTPTCTIIGDGPEMPKLRSLAEQFQLDSQVEFKGAMREGRGEVVARHRIMAIPSVWAEPFGVVALEGIASQCTIVASNQGGLPDAAGPAGLYFPNGDANAMAEQLEKLLIDRELQQRLVSNGQIHLQEFQPAFITRRYLSFFEKLLNK